VAPRTISPERREHLKKVLRDEKPNLDRMRADISDDDARWSKEITALETRVHTEAVEIDLGGGASIAIRTCLTGDEGKRLDVLEKAQALEQDADKKEEMAAEMIEIVTLNPLITKEWILENKDKYSPSDILRVLLGFMEVRIQERTDRVKRIRSAASFLPDTRGTELR
jgi:hypothetical protein